MIADYSNSYSLPGYCPVNQPLFSFGEDHYTSFPNANYQLALPNPYEPLNNIQVTTSMICIEELLFWTI
jgi:hypothetical protein